MKIAVFSDVHANLQAFEAFKVMAKESGATSYICLGDTVGYGGNPRECLAGVRELTKCGIEPFHTMIHGNHDWVIGQGEIPEWFNGAARVAVAQHIKILDAEEKAFLAGLSHEAVLKGRFKFVHGSPKERFDYILDDRTAAENMLFLAENKEENICFIGHSHYKPTGWILHNGISLMKWIGDEGDGGFGASMALSEVLNKEYDKFHIQDSDMAIINVGSVGQPRDRDPRGAFALFDDEGMTVEFIRFEYDIAGAQKAIRDIGNPDWLASRLAEGR